MRPISIYIIGIIFVSVLLIVLGSQTKLPQGAKEMQVYSAVQPDIDSPDYIDTMSNFNIYHYSNIIGINDSSLDNTLGVAYIYAKESTDAQNIIDKLNAKIEFSEPLQDGITYYGYCKGLDKSVEIDDKQINVQIVSNKDNIIVGFPLIMGSY